MRERDGQASRIAVVGPGAIGGTVAARLASKTQHELVLCARRDFAGVELEAPDGHFEARVRPLLRPSEARPVDWVMFAVKAHQTTSAAIWLDTLVDAGTTIAILQNGVEHVQRLAAFAKQDALLPVVVTCPARAVAPGRIEQHGPARLVVPACAAGEAFRALFEGTGIEVDVTDDFTTACWMKLCSNAVGGAITALAGRPLGVMRRPAVADLARALLAETMAVGRAEGARFPDNFAEELLMMWQRGPANAGTSMLYDRMDGNPLEYDARNAVIVRLGHRHGIATPVSQTVTALLAAASDPPVEDMQ